MTESLGDLLSADGSGPAPNRVKEAARHYGILIGVVTNNQDPDKLGRVKVWIPDLSESDANKFETTWARLCTPMAGKERGFYSVPHVEDEVLVAFCHGDIAYPIVLGSAWNGEDLPPQTNDMCSKFAEDNVRGGGTVVDYKIDDKNSPYDTKAKDYNENKENELRFMRSKSGHLAILDDTKSNERVTFADKTHENRFSLRSKPNKVVFTSEKGDIELYAPKGTIYLEAKQIQTLTDTATKIESKDKFDVLSKGKMKAESKATQDFDSQGKMAQTTQASLERSASMSVNVQAGSTMKLEAAASMTCKASLIQLN